MPNENRMLLITNHLQKQTDEVGCEFVKTFLPDTVLWTVCTCGYNDVAPARIELASKV